MTQVIIYLQDNGIPAVIIPCPECGLSIQEIAEKDVPTGKPFSIIDEADLPEGVPQEYWMVNEADLTDGVGA